MLMDWLKGLDSPPIKDETLAFESQILKDAFAEWSRHGPLPSRCDFTPRSSKAFLGNLAIFEQHGTTFRIRLMGTRITTVIGEMQGKTLEECLPPETAGRWKAFLNEALATRKPIRVVKSVGFRDLHFLEAEILVAPLLDRQDCLTMVFIVAAFRFGISGNRKLDKVVASGAK